MTIKNISAALAVITLSFAVAGTAAADNKIGGFLPANQLTHYDTGFSGGVSIGGHLAGGDVEPGDQFTMENAVGSFYGRYTESGVRFGYEQYRSLNGGPAYKLLSVQALGVDTRYGRLWAGLGLEIDSEDSAANFGTTSGVRFDWEYRFRENISAVATASGPIGGVPGFIYGGIKADIF